MKKNEIIYKFKNLYTNKKLYLISLSVIAIGIIITFLILKSDYIKSVIDGDPNYEKLKEKVSLYAYRETISLNEFSEDKKLIKNDSDKPKGPITAANILGGFDEFTQSQIMSDTSDDSSTNNWSNNISSDVENTNFDSDTNNNSNNTELESDVNKEETIIDKSSFTGKDAIVLEGEKFNPFEVLQLSANDIDGKNITDKIVISENNVDIYKPGLYNVKANVELSDGRKLYKEFLIRIQPVKLQLSVKDIEVSKNILQKKEMYSIRFKVKSSKNYLDVATVNINGKEYYPNKISEVNLFSKYDTYSIALVADDKAGIENVNFNTITMSDGTVVEINKFITIEVLKEQASISNVIIENVANNIGQIRVAFSIKDVDDTINEVKIYVYDEEDNVIIEEKVDKNKDINSILNVNKNGVYTIKIVADEKIELVTQDTKEVKKVELYSTKLEIDNIELSEENISDENMQMETYMNYSEKNQGLDNTNDFYSNQENIEYEQKYSITDKLTADILTNAEMTADTGETPKKTISVTVPTKANFTVNRNSDFIGTKINIVNNSEIPIDISIANFIDVNSDDGIKLITDRSVRDNNLITNYNRNEINLYLENKNKRIYLGNKKLYSSLGNAITDDEEKNIGKALPNSNCEISLLGQAGQGGLERNKPIRDTFTLVLKIKKSS